MKVTILTIFPGFFQSPLSQSLLRKAIDSGRIQVNIVDLRDYATDKHRSVDDAPFGGGGGMVMMLPPVHDALADVLSSNGGENRRIVLTAAGGRKLDQSECVKYSLLDHLVIICGRYKGVDERIFRFFDIEAVSIGDFILNGGEIAALAILESVFRLLPGGIGKIESALSDSFSDDDLLGAPVWTRPAKFRGVSVPKVMLEGDHARQELFRRWCALAQTMENRPDLLRKTNLSDTDRRMIEHITSGDDFEDCF
jgi:tRNA (guanine37-N1)-methyltransferase